MTLFSKNEIVAETGQRQGNGTVIFTAGGGDFEFKKLPSLAASTLLVSRLRTKTGMERLDSTR